MSSVKNVYYFCNVYFRDSVTYSLKYPAGTRYYNEIKCIRLYQGDSRIDRFKNDKYSSIISFDYGPSFRPFNSGKEDIEKEKEHILQEYKYYNRGAPNVVTITNTEN